MTPEQLIFIIGGVCGFFVGRWWSEVGRGRHDARRAWRQRRDYRKRK